jgi:hypothetical protein
MFGLGWASILLATLLTRPESIEVLRTFYRDVRPIGFWGPVQKELDDQEREMTKRHARAELIACGWGIAFYFLMVLGVFAAFGRHLFLAGVSSACAILAGLMFARSLRSMLIKI